MDIQIEHLDKAYGENQVLKDFSAVIPEGKTTCIMAPSGKGKTTLLNILLGLEPYDRGIIRGLEGKKKSAVFQEDRLCENLSSRANIRMVRRERAAVAVSFQKDGRGPGSSGTERMGRPAGTGAFRRHEKTDRYIKGASGRLGDSVYG